MQKKGLTTIYTNRRQENLKVQSKSVHLEITAPIAITTLMIVGLHQSIRGPNNAKTPKATYRTERDYVEIIYAVV